MFIIITILFIIPISLNVILFIGYVATGRVYEEGFDRTLTWLMIEIVIPSGILYLIW